MAPGCCGARDIFSAITPLYYASKVMGLVPFSYSNTSEEIPKISNFRTAWWHILYTMLSVGIFIALYVNIIEEKIFYEFSKDAVGTIVFMVYVTLLSLAAMLSQINGLLHREYLQLIMVKIAEVDQILIKNPTQVYSKIKLFLFVELGILYTYIFASYSENLFALLHSKSFWNLTFRAILLFLNQTTCILFINFNILLKQRFSMLQDQLMSVCGYSYEYIFGNDASIVYAETHIHTEIPLHPVNAVMTLTWPFTDSTTSFKKFLPGCNRQNQVHLLRQTHSCLCDIMDLINKYFGVLMLLIIGGQFVSIVYWLYEILNSVVELAMKPSRFISFFATLMIYIIMLSCIMMCGQFLSDKSNQTSSLVCRLLMHPLPPDVAMEMSAFLQQLPPIKVQLTAYGFFPFDFSFLLNIVASVVQLNIILFEGIKK